MFNIRNVWPTEVISFLSMLYFWIFATIPFSEFKKALSYAALVHIFPMIIWSSIFFTIVAMECWATITKSLSLRLFLRLVMVFWWTLLGSVLLPTAHFGPVPIICFAIACGCMLTYWQESEHMRIA